MRRWHSGRTDALALLVLLLQIGLAGEGVAADGSRHWLDAVRDNDTDRLGQLLAGAGAGRQRPEVEAATRAGKTALMAAARAADVDLMGRLLAAGAAVDRRNRGGGTALMYAAIGGDPAAIRRLLAAGAEVNARSNTGWTALTVASARGNTAAVRTLLALGADPEVRDIYMWTPLMRAAYEGHPGVVEALLAGGRADIDARDENGVTALHHAVANGRGACVRVLLSHGAANLRDEQGRTPFDAARITGHEELLPLLARNFPGAR